MRVLLSTYDSRGGVEPLVGLAVQLRAAGAEVRVCAPPDEEFAERLAGFGVPLVPFGESVRAMMTAATPPSEADLRRHVDDTIAAQFGTVAATAEGCDALVATGLVWTAAGARSVTEKLGIHYVYASYHPTHLPSPHHPPPSYWGLPFQMFRPDNRLLWDLDAQNANALLGPTLNSHRASIGLQPVDKSATSLHRPPVAGGGSRPGPVAGAGGSRRRPNRRVAAAGRTPTAGRVGGVPDAGTPPVYVGFGSMPVRGSKDIVRMAIEAIRAQGRRALLSHGWANLALIDDRDDCFAVGEVNQQALFGRVAAVVHHGGAGTTTTAARAGAPQVVIPQGKDQLYWAGRVAELGIGTAYDGRSASTESLSAALKLTLTPETRDRVSAVAGTIRTDGAMVAATLLIDTISQERPPASA